MQQYLNLNYNFHEIRMKNELLYFKPENVC